MHRLRRTARRQLDGLLIRLGAMIDRARSRTLPEFANRPSHVTIEMPWKILNGRRIILGNHVWLGPGSFLNAATRYPGVSNQHPGAPYPVQEFDSRIIIGDRVTSTGGLQIGAVREVVVEDDVLFAANVFISDSTHGYERADIPYKYQALTRIAPVRIKKGSWIGQNVVILSGVTIGEYAVVGANSVVTKSIPDRCIAAGAPARIIKVWSEGSKAWTAPDLVRREECV
jgi:acetyltransferase-like isoleucine patch superfamily enzyme